MLAAWTNGPVYLVSFFLFSLSFYFLLFPSISNEVLAAVFSLPPRRSFYRRFAVVFRRISPAVIFSRLFPRIVMRSRYRQRFSTSRARSASTLLALRRTMKIPTRPRRRFSRLGQPHVFAIRPLPRAFLLSSNQYCEASCTGQVRRWSRFQMRRRERRGVKLREGGKKPGYFARKRGRLEERTVFGYSIIFANPLSFCLCPPLSPRPLFLRLPTAANLRYCAIRDKCGSEESISPIFFTAMPFFFFV